MANTKLEGAELKKFVQLAKNICLSFAFSPDAKGDHTMLIDKVQKPRAIGQKAKSLGSGNKVAYGTLELNAGTLELTCEQSLPELARILKKFMKDNKISVDVQIMDATGAQGRKPDHTEESSTTADSASEGTDQTSDSADTKSQDKAKLATRIKAILPAIAGASAKVAAQLDKAQALAMSQINTGDLAKAGQTITAMEQAIAKARADKTQAGPDIRALAARSTALKDIIAKIAGPAALDKALAKAVAHIRAGDLNAADALLAKIETAVTQVTSTPSQTENPPSPEATKWTLAEAKLQTALDRLIKANRGDLVAIERVFDLGKKHAAAGRFDDAMVAAAQTAGLIAKTGKDPTPLAIQGTSDSNLGNGESGGFDKICSEWIAVRSGLQNQFRGLKSAIDTATDGIAGLEDVPSKSGVLFDHLGRIDTGLEDALKQLGAPLKDGKAEGLKSTARKIVDQYRAVLDTDFFKAVDDSGFATTSIRATTLASLNKVSAALEA